MKKLKFRLNRTSLSLLYTSFIRPQLEYASEVWGGCSSVDSDRLEKIQLIAARIVTGLPIFASRESLYFETGWDTLSCRRQISRLKTMYKFDRNMLPIATLRNPIFSQKNGQLYRIILPEIH